jgi:hypothetical protein
LSVEGTEGKYEPETLPIQLDLLALRPFLEAHFSLQLQERYCRFQSWSDSSAVFQRLSVKVDLVYFTLSNLSSLPGLMAPLQSF